MSYSSLTFPSNSLATFLSYTSFLGGSVASLGSLLKGLDMLVFTCSILLYVTVTVI
jgi:hypothetical protein